MISESLLAVDDVRDLLDTAPAEDCPRRRILHAATTAAARTALYEIAGSRTTPSPRAISDPLRVLDDVARLVRAWKSAAIDPGETLVAVRGIVAGRMQP